MSKIPEQRRPTPCRPPRGNRHPSVYDLPDDYGVPVGRDFLVRQQNSGLYGHDGLRVDGRRWKGDYDEPGYMGDLTGINVTDAGMEYPEQLTPFGDKQG